MRDRLTRNPLPFRKIKALLQRIWRTSLHLYGIRTVVTRDGSGVEKGVTTKGVSSLEESRDWFFHTLGLSGISRISKLSRI